MTCSDSLSLSVHVHLGRRRPPREDGVPHVGAGVGTGVLSESTRAFPGHTPPSSLAGWAVPRNRGKCLLWSLRPSCPAQVQVQGEQLCSCWPLRLGCEAGAVPQSGLGPAPGARATTSISRFPPALQSRPEVVRRGAPTTAGPQESPPVSGTSPTSQGRLSRVDKNVGGLMLPSCHSKSCTCGNIILDV